MKYYFSFCIVLSLMLFLSTNLISQENAVNDFIAEQKYDDAINVILMGGEIKKLSTTSLENLGYCYLMTRKYGNAETVYAELLTRPKVAIENHVSYAELLLISEKYQQAKEHFLTYLSENEDDLLVYNRMVSCDSLKKWNSEEQDYTIESFNEMNTAYNEICACQKDENFIYLSNKEYAEGEVLIAGNGIPQLNSYNSQGTNKIKDYLTNKYWCSLTVYSESRKQYAHSVRKISKSLQEITLAKSVILFESENNNSIDGLEKFTWQGMPDDINISHPSFTKNGNRLYFTSDMPNGYGGMDIYYSDYKNNQWTVPVNLGNKINTPLDEIAPVVNDSVLYFSSLGLPGYGNFDVFISHIDGNSFSKPENLKAPINSIGQDMFFYPYAGNEFLLSSRRSSIGKGGFDVYKLTKIQDEPVIVPDETVVVVVHQMDIADFNAPKVFFKTNSSEIYSNYDNALKNLADSLIEYKDVHVQLSGYTDISGTDAINSELSIKRAESVAQKLFSFGVPKSQITFEGLSVKQDVIVDNLRYHVAVGTINNDEGAEWFSNRLENRYDILVLPNSKYYSYCVGDFDNIAEADLLKKEIEEKYDLTGVSIASYLGRGLPNFEMSINRRVDFRLFRKK
ncbi:MAG: OmpA family protein [Bacteroidales bacterium]|nr:OmpA family protein [Bacteroidales bacterium]